MKKKKIIAIAISLLIMCGNGKTVYATQTTAASTQSATTTQPLSNPFSSLNTTNPFANFSFPSLSTQQSGTTNTGTNQTQNSMFSNFASMFSQMQGTASSGLQSTSNTGLTNPFSGINMSTMMQNGFQNLPTYSSSLSNTSGSLQSQTLQTPQLPQLSQMQTSQMSQFSQQNMNALSNVGSLFPSFSTTSAMGFGTSVLNTPQTASATTTPTSTSTTTTAPATSTAPTTITSTPVSTSTGTTATSGTNTSSSVSLVDIPSSAQMEEENKIVVNDGYSVITQQEVADSEILKYLTEEEKPYIHSPYIDTVKILNNISEETSDELTDEEILTVAYKMMDVMYLLQLEPDQLELLEYGKVMYLYRYTIEQLNKAAEQQTQAQAQPAETTQTDPTIESNNQLNEQSTLLNDSAFNNTLTNTNSELTNMSNPLTSAMTDTTSVVNPTLDPAMIQFQSQMFAMPAASTGF